MKTKNNFDSRTIYVPWKCMQSQLAFNLNVISLFQLLLTASIVQKSVRSIKFRIVTENVSNFFYSNNIKVPT